MFDLYFGDYNSIISNYLEPVNNINLIIENILPKVIMNDKVNLASNILQYMYNYFKNNKKSPHIYRFIEQNIAVNFFVNNKLLLPEIIYFINEKILNDDEIVKMILKNNSKNMNFYENRHLILSYDKI
jgi:hypothetical protein